MLDKIIAFFMSIISFFLSLFGISIKNCQTFENVKYGDHERQVLDLYIPEDAEGTMGLVLMIHGGAWVAGDKESYRENCKTIAKDYGCAAATINYRYLSETVTMNDILDDITAATAKIRAVGEANGVIIDKMILTGMSAGGHLSLLYSYSRAGEAAIRPVAVVNQCGPADFTDKNFLNSSLGADNIYMLFSWATGTEITADNMEGNPDLLAVSPVTYAATAVPTVTAHGVKDSIVPFSNATALDNALKNAGVRHDFIPYPNSDHDLGSDKDCESAAFDLYVEYINEYLR